MGGGALPGGETIRADVLETIEQEKVRRERDERKKILIDLFSALYDKACTYTTLILAAGYAGFFATWDAVRGTMSRAQLLSTAFLMAFSLVTFILWQIYVMFQISQQHMALANVIGTPDSDFDKAMDEHNQAEAMTRVRLANIWRPVFWVTTLSGLTGAFVLLYVIARNLIAQ